LAGPHGVPTVDEEFCENIPYNRKLLR